MTIAYTADSRKEPQAKMMKVRDMQKRTTLTIALLLPILAIAGSAQADFGDVYVNNDWGSDAWTGASPVAGPDGPKATLDDAITAANQFSGKTIYLQYTGIEYTASSTIVLHPSGTPGPARLIGLSNNGLRVSLSGEYNHRIIKFEEVNDPVDTTFPRIENLYILYGDAGNGDGGGVLVSGSDIHPTISNCQISICFARNGGGVALGDEGASLTILDSNINTNVATENGGGLYASMGNNNDILDVRDSRFAQNEASVGGGAAVFGDASSGNVTMSFSGTTFAHNTSSAYGGGLHVNGVSNLELSDNSFLYNVAEDASGGGLSHSHADKLRINKCTFTGNDALAGGAIAVWDFSINGHVTNSVFLQNTAVHGAGLFAINGDADVTNCTFTQNTANWGDAAYNSTASASTYTNCIFWGNAGGADLQIGGAATQTVNYSDYQGGWTGVGSHNISADPLFASDTIRLRDWSPCLDVGNNTVSVGLEDADGALRRNVGVCVGNVWTPTIDMGAFERQSTVPSPIYVDADAVACGGGSWANPVADLRFALAVAAANSSVVNEIWVKQGTYYPDSDTDLRTRTFRIPNGVSVYGGFAGGEKSLDQRDPAARSTLSGNIGSAGDDDNSYHVLSSNGSGVLVDGFFIRDGNANGSGFHANAGGVDLRGAVDVEIHNCSIVGNKAFNVGAGIYAVTGSKVIDCWILGNTQPGVTAGGGGAVLDGTAFVDRCVFFGNSAVQGGGIFVNSGMPDIRNSLFFNNTSTFSGGGIWFHQDTTANVTNCTIADNGGGLGDGIYMHSNAAPLLTNTIIWNNGNQNIGWSSSNGGTANHCNIGPTPWSGAGGPNIDTDPRFCLFYPESCAANSRDYQCDVYSPCLDAGDHGASPGNQEVDLFGDPRYVDGSCGVESWDPGQEEWPWHEVNQATIDIGAYESPHFVLRGEDHDCNGDSFPDHCHAKAILEIVDSLYDGDPALSAEFRNGRYPTYQSILAGYGRPWAPDSGQDPTVIVPTYNAQPARALLAAALEGLCSDTSDMLLREVSDMFMLLGNEAYADALDSTVGLGDGINIDLIGDYFAFEGVPGINSLIDEELALLRGREINDDFVGNDGVNYPEYTDQGEIPFRAAIYNRLPPNAEGTGDHIAYRSTYGMPLSNHAAALAFPQGHGDSYGYYLSGVKTFLGNFNDPDVGPYLISLQPNDVEDITTGADPEPVEVPYRSVRMMAVAMGARARAASLIVDRTFRNNYTEGAENPGADIAEFDPDDPDTDASQRAWMMSDWASRSAMGSYLDWAMTNHLIPEGDPEAGLEDPNRQNLDEIDQMVGAVAEMQSRVDWAAGGRNPLGLVQNVVPFGIDAEQLMAFIGDPETGKSHYGQVRTPAVFALANASFILKWANQAAQRMRGSDEELDDFEVWTQDQEIAYENQLVEIYGLPSDDDPADNDLDGLTGDDESHSPDLVRFLLTNEDLAELGAAPRRAPGEIQIAMGEIRVAQLRIEQARAVLTALNGNIAHLRQNIEQLRDNNDAAIEIRWQTNQKMITLEDRMEELAVAEFETDEVGIGLGILGDVVGAAADCFGNSAGQCAGILVANGAASVIGAVQAERAAKSEQEKVEAEFDIARERINVTAWADMALAEIEGDNVEMNMIFDLEGFIRETPQVMLDIGIAREQLGSTIGRLAAAVSRGERLQADRERMRKLARDELEGYRWSDLAFRVYRNEALQKYRGFFDLASRYVMLAGRSYAYEYNRRDTVEDLLAGLHRETRLGSDPDNPDSPSGGLSGIITRLDADQVFEVADAPWGLNNKAIEFSLRKNLLGLPEDETDRDANIAFRAWLESNIEQRLEVIPEFERFALLSSSDDFGSAIVLRLATQIGPGFNFFGQPVFVGSPYGSSQFNFSYHTNMVYEYEVRFDNAGLDALPNTPSGKVSIWMLPTGESMFRGIGGGGDTIEDHLVRGWAVVNQRLRPIGQTWNDNWEGDNYSAWVDVANAGGDFFNAIKRFEHSDGQVPHFAPDTPILNQDRVGRTAWNTNWILAIPGAQWASADPEEIRRALMIFIYGQDPESPPEDPQPAAPEANLGITDIKWVVQGYHRAN